MSTRLQKLAIVNTQSKGDKYSDISENKIYAFIDKRKCNFEKFIDVIHMLSNEWYFHMA